MTLYDTINDIGITHIPGQFDANVYVLVSAGKHRHVAATVQQRMAKQWVDLLQLPPLVSMYTIVIVHACTYYRVASVTTK